jgi:DNA-binding PadR family transcriptional regulator
MKQLVKLGLGNFWSFPHSQLYAEPERLARLGLLSSEQEETGRRRRLYSLTETGRSALAQWLGEPAEGGTEIRDLALLKLFFCGLATRADTVRVAQAAAEWHGARVGEWEEASERLRGLADACQLATLDLGIRYERAAAAFWREIAADPPTAR